MKQLFCGRWAAAVLILGLLVLAAQAAGGHGMDSGPRIYWIIGPGETDPPPRTLESLEAFGAEIVGSAYFDRALDYKGTQFRAISFADLIDRFDPLGRTTAVLLNCFDDYQGILSIEDIGRYDLRLATRIEVLPEYEKPDWLHPLLVLVPDGSDAPFQERFLTANIRELVFVDLDAYYAPLRAAAGTDENALAGYAAFVDNCLFCHSLEGVGGNKGIPLLENYDFSSAAAKERFKADFYGFHHADNPDKQNVEQFVTPELLENIAGFLARVGGR